MNNNLNMHYGGATKNTHKKKTREDTNIDITKNIEKSGTYFPIIYKLQDIKDSIFNYDISPIFSTNSPMPRFNLGMNYYSHSTKDKMEIIPTLATKRKFYYITNTFEHFVDGSPEHSISTHATKYFELNKRVEILSRGFFKLWEMIMMFNLIPTDTSDFVSAHLAEGPGAFLQATMYYREHFIEKKYTTKNDKYYAITLHDESEGKHIPQLEKKFIETYAKEKPQRVVIHQTNSIKDLQGGSKRDNGDLTKVNTILHFGGKFKERKADFITADGGINWEDENMQEQESFKLIFGEICQALLIQEKGGKFVVKLFESFTALVCKLIIILKDFYTDVFIFKPLMSRISSSEKYLICLGYKGYNAKKIDTLLKVLKEMGSTPKVLFDIFPDYEFDKSFLGTIKAMNTEIENKQIESINKMIIYIEKQDYYGSMYHKFKDAQIKSSEYWISVYFPDELKKSNEILKSTIKKSLIDSDERSALYQRI
jgi:23S rRNA U2552 (ribose-2'-O)-methylase RlmE/FtsJ